MNKCLITALTSIAIIALPCLSIGQEENMEYSYATVTQVNLSNNEIVVNEYDWNNDTEVTVVYSVSPDARFENVASLKEIKTNDEVSIEYIEKEGRRIARSVSVYKEEPEPTSKEYIPEMEEPDLQEME